MITNFKRKDLQAILHRRDGFPNEISLVADKLRTIYVLHGWTHMIDEYGKTDDVVDGLTDQCLQYLLDNPTEDEFTIMSAGLRVIMFIDEEDFINVEYYYHLI